MPGSDYEQLLPNECLGENELKPTIADSTSTDVPLSPNEHPGLSTELQKSKQFWRLFRTLFWGYLFQVVLWFGFLGAMMTAQHYSPLDHSHMRFFNTVTTGIPLLIGLNTSSAFKEMASIMRWKVLAQARHSAKETDLILQLSSYRIVTQLAYNWAKKGLWVNTLWCCSWVALMLNSQIATGLLSLTYDAESGALKAKNGEVNVTDFVLQDIQDGASDALSVFTLQHYAHFSGEAYPGILIDHQYDSPLAEEELSYGNLRIYYEVGVPVDNPGSKATTYLYQFQDWTITPKLTMAGPLGALTGGASAPTNRFVDVSTSCNEYPIIKDKNSQKLIEGLPDQRHEEWWNITELTYRGDFLNSGVVTYVNMDSYQLPQNTSSEYRCGNKRCALIGAYTLSNDFKSGKFYECAVNISDVQNALLNQHNISDFMARVLAGSIASTGILSWTGADDAYTYAQFGMDNYWGFDPQGRDFSTQTVEAIIGEFTTRAIGMWDAHGISYKSTVSGTTVYPGTIIKIKTDPPYFYIILGFVLGLHGLLFIPVLLLGNTVIYREESYLTAAKLLKPLIEQVGDRGAATSPEKLAQTIDKQPVMQNGVSYGYIHVLSSESISEKDERGYQKYRLGLINHRNPQAVGFFQEFPEGTYDRDTGPLEAHGTAPLQA